MAGQLRELGLPEEIINNTIEKAKGRGDTGAD